jgi:hypothetical protein
MSNIDYTPVILAQITDLQLRITKQDGIISSLKAEVERLSGHTINVRDTTMQTSIPLRSIQQLQNTNINTNTRNRDRNRINNPRDDYNQDNKENINPKENHHNHRHREREHNYNQQRVNHHSHNHNQNNNNYTENTFNLANILNEKERVTIEVNTQSDNNGKTSAIAEFNGKELVIIECELVPSLIGMKSSKPGEILYRFIQELKSIGHIQKLFSIAPWKLCFVERNGIRSNLEQLRG